MPARKDGAVDSTIVERCRKSFSSNPSYKMALNAVTRGNLNEIAVGRDSLIAADMNFSNEIEVGPIQDQKGAGTCWLFAELNWLRTFVNKKLQIKNFEFSQAFVMFWDKFEKANYFLENMIEMREAGIDDRALRFLLDNPTSDGGEWDQLVNVTRKYGLIPKSVMPSSFNVENSRYLNTVLAWKLREWAATIRKMAAAGNTMQQIREFKESVLEEAYRIIAICLGEPPARFDWSFRKTNKKKTFVRWRNITPQQFCQKAVPVDPEEVFVLIHCPMSDMKYNKTYTVNLFNNTWAGSRQVNLNLPIAELKSLALKMLKAGEAVLFGCEVRLDMHSKEGVMDQRVFEYDLVFDTRLGLNKGERLEYGQARMTHAMVFSGVDLINGKPAKWKVENSWGDQFGKKGFFVMTDSWFDEHVMEIVAPKKHLPEKYRKLFAQKPIELPHWHPLA